MYNILNWIRSTVLGTGPYNTSVCMPNYTKTHKDHTNNQNKYITDTQTFGGWITEQGNCSSNIIML